MPSEYASPAPAETSLIISRIARDGKPGLADFVGCVAASTALGMTKSVAPEQERWLGVNPVARAHIGVAVNRAAGATLPS